MDPVTVNLALQMLWGLLDRVGTVSALIKRGDITEAELDALAADDDKAREALKAAIAKARAEGK